MGDPFNLPSTCTNSAYVLKSFYLKNCWDYEQVKVHGVAVSDLKTYVEEIPEPEFKKQNIQSVADTSAQPSLPTVSFNRVNNNSNQEQTILNQNYTRFNDSSIIDEEGRECLYISITFQPFHKI